MNVLLVGTDGRDKITPEESGRSTGWAARPATAPTRS